VSLTLLWWGLAAVTVVGAVSMLVAHEMMRMLLGLGIFLLGVAGLYAYYGFEFLAVAELFVYVGGVLVLILFAIMLVHRSAEGGPVIESRASVLSVGVCIAVAALLMTALLPASAYFRPSVGAATPTQLSALLLGRMLPQFEALGVLLLSALAAVVVIMAGDRE